jgi:hypothetical protein
VAAAGGGLAPRAQRSAAGSTIAVAISGHDGEAASPDHVDERVRRGQSRSRLRGAGSTWLAEVGALTQVISRRRSTGELSVGVDRADKMLTVDITYQKNSFGGV